MSDGHALCVGVGALAWCWLVAGLAGDLLRWLFSERR